MTRLATMLWLVASALALTAAAVRFAKSGEVPWGNGAAGLFLLATDASVLSKRTRPPASEPPARNP